MARKKPKRPKGDRAIEGRNPVREALLAKADLDQIWMARGLVENEKIKEIFRLAVRQKVLVRRVPRQLLERTSLTHRPQGVIAFGKTLPDLSLAQILDQAEEKKNASFLVLTESLDEQNLGAILRTAEAVGIQAVILPKKAKGVTPVVTRVAMGAVEHLPVIKTNLFITLKRFKDQGIKIIGATSQARKSLYQVDLTGPAALAIGGEDKGMTTTIRKNCDLLVSIPMWGRVSSLNMSVAWAVLAYEKQRQELVKNKS